MEKNVLQSTAILGVTLVTLTAITPLALVSADGGVYNTQAGITFIPSTDPTGPVNPDNPDPDKPTIPVDPDGKEDGNNGTNGPLSIDYVSAFDFGTQQVSSASKTYFAKSQSYKEGTTADTSLFSQVTDNRGTGAGWTLTVQQDKQLTSGTTELKGAQISLQNMNASTHAASEAGLALAGNDIKLVPGDGAQTIMSAKKGAGQGTWITKFGETKDLVTEKGTGINKSDRLVDKSVSLFVPGTSNKETKQQYSTNLTWTLTDTPANM